MTTPTNVVPLKTVALPAPQFPMLVLMFTDNIVPSPNAEETVQWTVSKPHPFVPRMNVVRMFIDRGGVEVYSSSSDGTTCMRDLVPMTRVRLVQEGMPLDVFVDELAAAESGDDDDNDPDPDPEPYLDEPQTSTPSNGQITP